MNNSIDPKKFVCILMIAVVVVVLGMYSSYTKYGLSVALLPSVISNIGIGLLFSEISTGTIAVVNLSDWKKIEIGACGKLALLFMAVGGVANSFVGG